jgi:hypothetical protein
MLLSIKTVCIRLYFRVFFSNKIISQKIPLSPPPSPSPFEREGEGGGMEWTGARNAGVSD